jgi:HAD superfamily hydrolase (TIGR01509 family)
MADNHSDFMVDFTTSALATAACTAATVSAAAVPASRKRPSKVAEKSIALVIFDCDGVLVDTEKFYVELLLELSAPYGLQLPLAEAMRLFTGAALKTSLEKIESLTGAALPDDFFARVRDEFARRIEFSIVPIEGVREALERITLPVCVASNSSLKSLQQMLSAVNLYHYFGDRIFSAYDLQKWKPEPDLFLKAAAEMNAHPQNCLVIEDSAIGVQAALAADMSVFAYVASEYSSAGLCSANIPTFERMIELPEIIERLNRKGA